MRKKTTVVCVSIVESIHPSKEPKTKKQNKPKGKKQSKERE
jgi:hypothetical protein